jgi:hypothetical protein
MTDDITEKLELRRRQYASIAHARCSRLLRGQELKLDDDTIPLILNLIDSFVSQSQGNKRVKILTLCPYSVDGSDDVFWDKVGQAVGNLQALEALHISGHHNNNEDYSGEDEDYIVPIPDWEILARILGHVRQNVRVAIEDQSLRTIQEVQPFTRAIGGRPTITSLYDLGMFPYESLETFFLPCPHFRLSNQFLLVLQK